MNNNYVEEDEIDLRELFKTIWDSKALIVSITLVITLLAGIYAFLKTPIYKAESNIQVGFIGEKLIDTPETIIKSAKLVFNVDSQINDQKEFISEVTAISKTKSLDNFIKIETEGTSQENAVAKNKEVVSYIQNKYKTVIQRYILDNTNSIKNIEKKIQDIDNFEKTNLEFQINVIKKQTINKINNQIKYYKIYSKTIKTKINFLQKQLKSYQKEITNIYNSSKQSKDTSFLTLTAIQNLSYQNLILSTQTKIEDLKLELDEINLKTLPDFERKKSNLFDDNLRKLQYKLDVTIPNKKQKLLETIEQLKFKSSNLYTQNSKVVGRYISEDIPSKPKKKLIIVVAFITGFILSIFLVFFLSFIRSMKEEN